MVSRPEGNFTYSEWMSERSGAVEGGGGRWGAGKANSTPASTATPPPTCTAFHRLAPPSTALVPITHPPDPIARVVAHQQRSIRHHQESDRSPPARPVGKLPPGDEVVNRSRLTVLHVHPHHLRARRHRAIPGAVVRHERVAGVVSRKHGTRVERKPERR